SDPDFVQFKCDLVSSFVEEASKKMRALHPKMQFSCAVYPTREKAIRYAAQDWDRWLKMGWIDQIYPMSYTEDPAAFKNYLEEAAAAIKESGSKAKLVIGIGAYKEKMAAETFKQEVGLCQGRSEISGICFFNAYSLFREDLYPLLKSNFKEPAP
ncbi:MAG TPA: family 10 glycosylhydrolase, partial [Chroococcales cyanobacterium]